MNGLPTRTLSGVTYTTLCKLPESRPPTATFDERRKLKYADDTTVSFDVTSGSREYGDELQLVGMSRSLPRLEWRSLAACGSWSRMEAAYIHLESSRALRVRLISVKSILNLKG